MSDDSTLDRLRQRADGALIPISGRWSRCATSKGGKLGMPGLNGKEGTCRANEGRAGRNARAENGRTARMVRTARVAGMIDLVRIDAGMLLIQHHSRKMKP
ncbi:MAG: hypothetical protein RKO24_01425 [Candidatus Competibacter sp.]|nr:hypothetical protein [Candidatus Competibacter sp.]